MPPASRPKPARWRAASTPRPFGCATSTRPSSKPTGRACGGAPPATALTTSPASTPARRVTFASGDEAALLVVEFTGETTAEALAAAAPLAGRGRLLSTPEAQGDLWAVRRGGMGIIMNVPGDLKPIDFVEDVSVPVA